jgi:hypothetical protein
MDWTRRMWGNQAACERRRTFRRLRIRNFRDPFFKQQEIRSRARAHPHARSGTDPKGRTPMRGACRCSGGPRKRGPTGQESFANLRTRISPDILHNRQRHTATGGASARISGTDYGTRCSPSRHNAVTHGTLPAPPRVSTRTNVFFVKKDLFMPQWEIARGTHADEKQDLSRRVTSKKA